VALGVAVKPHRAISLLELEAALAAIGDDRMDGLLTVNGRTANALGFDASSGTLGRRPIESCRDRPRCRFAGSSSRPGQLTGQAEREQLARIVPPADGNDDVLLAVEHVGHRRAALRRRHQHCANVLTVGLIVRAQ